MSQVLHSGMQTIVLNSQGQATGGYFFLNNRTQLSTLQIPSGVTGIFNAASHSGSVLDVLGSLINSGTLDIVSSSNTVTNASIVAANIFNLAGATITSIQPAGGVAGLSNLAPSVSFSLTAAKDIINSGTISSSAGLNLVSGNSLHNVFSTSTSGAMPSLQARGDIYLQAGAAVNNGSISSTIGNITAATNTFTNYGNVQALAGSLTMEDLSAKSIGPGLNVTNSGFLSGASGLTFVSHGSATGIGSPLSINNTGGLIQSSAGAINIQSAGDIRLTGGNVSSPSEINLVAPNGLVEVNVQNVTGTMNVTAADAHVTASTPNFVLGNLNVSGDPSYDNLTGTLTLGSISATGGQDVTLIASQDVILSGGTIDTTSAGGNAGNINIIAGANVVTSGSNLQFSGASSTGGAVDLTGVTAINAQGQGASGSGGNVQIVAFSGSNVGSALTAGSINTGNATISTGGSGTGSNGNVTVIAGATADPSAGSALAIAGSITASGGSGGSGSVSLYSATPSLSSTATVTNGSLSGGSFVVGSAMPTTISVASIQAGGGTLTLSTSGNISAGNLSNSALVSGNAGNITIANTTGTVSLGTLSANGLGNGNGGTISVSSAGSIYSDTISANGAGTGTGGTVNISSSASGMTFDYGSGSSSASTGGSPATGSITAIGAGNSGSVNFSFSGANTTVIVDVAIGSGNVVIGATGAGSSVSIQPVVGSPGVPTIVASNALTVNAGSGGIAIGNDASGAVVSLSAAGSSSIIQTAGTLGGTTSISLTSGSGDIVNVNSSTPSLTVNTTGSVTLTNSAAGAMTLTSGGDTFNSLSVSTDNTFTTTTPLAATGTLSLSTTANNGNLNIAAKLNAATVSLSTSGSGSINQTGGIITATALSLTSTSGNADPINTSVSTLAFNTSGSVVVDNASGALLTVGPGANAAGQATVQNNGDITTTGSLLVSGLVLLQSTSGNVTMSAPVTGGSVSFGGTTVTNNATVTANSGNVSFSASQIVLNAPIAVKGSGAAVSLHNAAAFSSLPLVLSGSSGLINATGGGSVSIIIQDDYLAGLNINSSFTVNAGTGTSSSVQLISGGSVNIAGGATVALQSAGSVSIQAPVVNLGTSLQAATLKTNTAPILSIETNSLTAYGTISSTVIAGSIQISNTAVPGTLTLTGAPVSITASGAGASNIQIKDVNSTALNVDSSYTLNAGTGAGSFVVLSSGAQVNIAGGTTQILEAASSISLQAPTITIGGVGTPATVRTSTAPLLNVQGNNLVDYGTITSSVSSGKIVISNTGFPGALTLSGAPISIATTGTGITQVNIQDVNNTAVNLNSSFTETTLVSGGSTILISSGAAVNIAGGTTQILNGSAKGTISAPTVTVGAAGNSATIQTTTSLALNIQTANLVDYGTITSSVAAGRISVSNVTFAGALTLSGALSTISMTGAGASIVEIQDVNLAGININSSYTLDAGAGLGSSALIASGSQVNIAGGTTQILNAGSTAIIQSPTITIGAAGNAAIASTTTAPILHMETVNLVDNGTITSSVAGGQIVIDNTGMAGALVLSGAPNAITTTGSGATAITVQGLGATSVDVQSSYTLDAGMASTNTVAMLANAGQLTVEGGVTLTLESGSTVTVQSPTVTVGVAGNAATIKTTTANLLSINTNNFVDNGTITSSTASGQVQISNTGFAGPLTLSGTPNPISTIGTGSPSVVIADFNSSAININSSFTLNGGSASASSSEFISNGGAVIVAGGTTQTLEGSASVAIQAPTITVGAAGNAATIQTSTATVLHISTNNLANNGTITSSVSGGTIRIDNNGFAAGLTLTGSSNPITVTAGGAAQIVVQSVSGNVTLSSPVSLALTGSPLVTGAILVESANDLNVNAALSLNAASAPATLAAGNLVNINAPVTSTGSGTLIIKSTGNNVILGADVTASGTISLGATGTATITQSGGTVQGIALNISVGTGNVGNLNIATSSITTTQTGAGSITLTDSIPLSNNALSTAGSGGFTFAETAGGAAAITITHAISTVGPVLLDATAGANSGVVIGSAVNGGTITVNASGSVTVNSGVTVSGGTGSTYNTPLVTNNGTISDLTQVTIQNGNALAVASGTGGIIAAPAVQLNSNVGSVTVSGNDFQSSVVSSTAGTTVTITAPGATLHIGTVVSNNGDTDITTTAGLLTVVPGGSLTANGVTGGSANVALTGANGLAIGTAGGAAVNINAGTLSGAVNNFSTTMSDYDMSAVVAPGAVKLSAAAGSIILGDNVSITSRGNSVAISGPGNVSLGSGDNIFAQGGNVWSNNGGTISIGSGTSVSAIARTIPGQPNITIAGKSVPAFQGGDVAFEDNAMHSNYDQYLRNTFDLTRTLTGFVAVTPNVGTLTNVTVNWSNNASVIITGPPSSITGSNATITANGAVVYLDPLTFGNNSILAVGPDLGSPVAQQTVVLNVTPAAGGGTPASAGGGAVVVAAAGIPVVIGTGAPIAPINAPTVTPVDQVALTPPLTITIRDQNYAQLGTAAQEASLNTEEASALTGQPVVLPDHVYVVGRICHPFIVNRDDLAVAVGKNGSIFSFDDDAPDDSELHGFSRSASVSGVINLKEGKIAVMAGKSNVLVRTDGGDVFLTAGASGLVEQTSAGVMRATHLLGQDLQMRVRGSTERLTAGGTQEIEIADESTDDEELIPMDGVERAPVSVSLLVASGGKKKVRTVSYNKTQMMSYIHLLICNSDVYQKYFRKSEQQANGQGPSMPMPGRNPVPAGSRNRVSSGSARYLPIAFPGVVQNSSARLVAVATSNSLIKHLGHAVINQQAPGIYTLESGEVLLSASKPVTVTSHGAWVKLKPNALVLLTAKNNVFSVKNLSDSTKDGVIVGFGSKFKSSVPIGREFISGLEVANLKPYLRDHVARRNILVKEAVPHCSVVTAEVSLATLVSANELLYRIFHSQQDSDRSITDRIMKMTAALSLVTGKHGPFATDQ